jgi:4-hydroxy-tetrahydrodipicolinate reductase
MGQAIMRLVAAADDLQIVGVCVRAGAIDAAKKAAIDAGLASEPNVVSVPAEIVGDADVVIDFSLPSATAAVLEAALNARKPLVSGVTGLDASSRAAIRDASSKIPLLYDRNMSIGIAVMQKLLQQAASSLGSDFVASVNEVHHVHKVDAPSGTALKLGETVANSRGQAFADVYRYEPDSIRDRTSRSDIVFHVSRAGENPGEHTVTFTSDMESLELTHKVTNRQVFAKGALRAARWLADRPSGLYSVADMTPRSD